MTKKHVAEHEELDGELGGPLGDALPTTSSRAVGWAGRWTATLGGLLLTAGPTTVCLAQQDGDTNFGQVNQNNSTAGTNPPSRIAGHQCLSGSFPTIVFYFLPEILGVYNASFSSELKRSFFFWHFFIVLGDTQLGVTPKLTTKRAYLRKSNLATAAVTVVVNCGTPVQLSHESSRQPVVPIYTLSAVFDVSGSFTDKKKYITITVVNGRVHLPRYEDPPTVLRQLLERPGFIVHIRAYNQMFSMTSFGAHVDDIVNTGHPPYVFKVSGQIYHWIGALCPPEGSQPRFLQFYIYNTDNEVENRMAHFGGQESNRLCQAVVTQLIHLLEFHNKLVKLFRTARDKCSAEEGPTFKVQLFSLAGSKQHALPTSDAVGAIFYDSGPQTITDYDVIIEPRSDRPTRVNKFHPLYMSLQYPLMFFYGEQRFHPDLMLRGILGSQGGRAKKMSMNMYYSYQIHDRLNVYSLMLRCGRLFQQYVVTVYCSIELDRMDYIRRKQKDIRSEYFSGLYDAIDRGDKRGLDVGSRTILPASFTGGPRYIYSHYLDALAICRVFGNPQFFITFTCNAKWREITRYLRAYPRLTPSDRADVIARAFYMKVKEFIVFLKEQQPLGDFRGVLYTIEFQKRGLPHCHTLLWLHSTASTPITERLDDYISAELPDPRSDPAGYAVISATMMHRPCGAKKPRAPCMEGFSCKKKFPKKYNNKTFFDTDGRAHY
ncbi:uncharacterized protein [Rutidosis leptorrhynchoides]|uniref:uncharacterized protein n=1 Tax=Rutidosis leptorrhynchoides TaxID=125765 RepID=UPI003A9949B1